MRLRRRAATPDADRPDGAPRAAARGRLVRSIVAGAIGVAVLFGAAHWVGWLSGRDPADPPPAVATGEPLRSPVEAPASGVDPSTPRPPDMPSAVEVAPPADSVLPSASAPASAPVAPAAPAAETGAPAASAAASTASAVGAAGASPDTGDDVTRLAARRLDVPVQGIARSALVDAWDQPRAGGPHRAIDIMAPAGTPVVAVEDGRIAKLFTSQAGGLTIYQFDPAGEYAYYYAHLERYEDGVADGAEVRRGQVIGRVGATGSARADAPHLHFEITRLGPDKKWWKGTPVNPHPVLRGEP